MNRIVNKDEFVEIIDDIKKVSDYHNDLNKFFSKNNVDGCIYQPDCIDTLLKTLAIMFNDTFEWIEVFVFELNFGKKWEEGCIQDGNGRSIRLSTSEELYDFLCSQMQGGE